MTSKPGHTRLQAEPSFARTRTMAESGRGGDLPGFPHPPALLRDAAGPHRFANAVLRDRSALFGDAA